MRYYAQYTDVADIFESKHRQGWQVFDREVLSPQGGVRPIVFCVNRHIAFRVREALNEQEMRK